MVLVLVVVVFILEGDSPWGDLVAWAYLINKTESEGVVMNGVR